MRKAIVCFFFIAFVWLASGILIQQWRSDPLTARGSRTPATAIDERGLQSPKPEGGQIYELKRALKTVFHSREKHGSLLSFNYEGEVSVLKVQDAKGKFWTQLKFDLRFRSESGKPEVRLTSRLPFLMELGPDHSLMSLRSPHSRTDSDRDELNLFRDLASLFAFRSTRDTTGEFDQEWIPGANGGGIKIKRNYRGELKHKIRIVRSLHEVALDEVGTVVQIKGSESTQISFQNSMELSTESSYELRLKPRPTPSAYAIHEKSPEPLSRFDLPSTDLKIEDSPRIDGTPEWRDGVLRLKRFSRLDGQGRLELFHDLLLSLRQDFSHVPELIRWVEGQQEKGAGVAFGIGVLAQLDSDEAQKALLKWYREWGEDQVFPHLILNALATSVVPLREETLQFLMSLPDSEGSAALVLGASLRISSNDEVRFKLKEEFESEVSEPKRAILLDAIGNSGDVFFVSTLRNALQAESVGVRERAALAARFLPGEAGSSILTAAYHDTNERVRQAAIQALEYSKDLATHQSLLKECARDGRPFCVRAFRP